jgi:hypothetical protein
LSDTARDSDRHRRPPQQRRDGIGANGGTFALALGHDNEGVT